MKKHKICGKCRNLVKGELNNIPFVACSGNVDNPCKCGLAKKFYVLKVKGREFLCPRENFTMFAMLKATDNGIKNPNFNIKESMEYLESLGYEIDVTD